MNENRFYREKTPAELMDEADALHIKTISDRVIAAIENASNATDDELFQIAREHGVSVLQPLPKRRPRPDYVPQAIVFATPEALLDLMRAMMRNADVPLDMVLYCPSCGLQHIDGPETMEAQLEGGIAEIPLWTNPPHRSHLCHGCDHIWRPSDIATNGVKHVKTKGVNDSPMKGSAS